MTDNQRYFLAVAEDLNISNAAKKLYISQQCLSKHIQRMEEHYHTKLFERKPKLALTPAGEVVREALYQIQVIESSLADKLDEINQKPKSSIVVGIVRARALSVIPDIVTEYSKYYPDIKILLQHDHTANLEAQVINGKHDFFIGVEMSKNNLLHYIPLKEERIFLVISDNTMRHHFGDKYQSCLESSLNEVDLNNFKNIPFVLNSSNEGLYFYIEKATKALEIDLNVMFQSDDPFVRARMCKTGYCASFFPEATLQSVIEESYQNEPDGSMHYFEMPKSQGTFKMVLAYHKNTFIPEYRKQFIRIATEVVGQNKRRIEPK